MGAGAAAHSRLAPGAAKLVEGGADDQVFDVDVHGSSTCWYGRPVALVMPRPPAGGWDLMRPDPV